MFKNSQIDLKLVTKKTLLNLPHGLSVKFQFNFSKLRNELHFLQVQQNTIVEAKVNDGLYIITNGRGEISSNSEHFRFKSGDIIFVSSGTEHRFLNCDNSTQAWAVFGAE